MKVVVGVYAVNDGELKDSTRQVEFEGQEIARHQWRTSETSGVRQRLFEVGDRYIVSVATWTLKPQERTIYTLCEISKADLSKGGEYEKLGAQVNLNGKALSLDAALLDGLEERNDERKAEDE